MKLTPGARIIIAVFRAIPLPLRKAIFRGLFRVFYHASLKHRIITLHNLTLSFPEKSKSEIERIAKSAYVNLAIMAAEFFEIPTLVKTGGFERIMSVEGMEHHRKVMSQGKGVLAFTAHLGNWELGVAYFGLRLQKVNIIYRTLDNPTLECLASWERALTGNALIPKGGATLKIREVLKNNELVGILMDQNVSWREGVFVDFFGRPACTTTGLATLALDTGAPVLPTFNVRMPDGTYRLIIKEEVEIIRSGDRERDIYENTRRITSIVEDMVRAYPDQWFWLHQRWKTKKTQVKEGQPRGRAAQRHNGTQ
jgi:KDO2-lipid IV(A) lauroyltransferase